MLDPQASLAMNVHAQPDVYALLLGSGVSTGAGVPTGWGVVQALVRGAAAASTPGDEASLEVAANDPEAWWQEHGDGKELGYSSLLASLARTSAARRDLLSKFFEPSEEDLEEGLKVPGRAHQAIAELVRRGSVKVILTTNFDRLIERAIEAVGISPQVVSNEDTAKAMTPLQHSRCTMIKLHGDYTDLEQRNTVEELSSYPNAINELLDRILDEYGLIVCGWSAEWDHALVTALERARRRRYPLFWAYRSQLTTAARRLVAQHQAVEIAGLTADDVFGGLVDRLEALDRLGEPPLTRAIAVARLKRQLPDPIRHIDVHELVMGEVEQVTAYIQQRPQQPSQDDAQSRQDSHDQLRREADTLLHLMVTGVYFDRDRMHTDLWVQVIRRLMAARRIPSGAFNRVWDALQHYPALLILRAAGLAALLAGRDDVLLRLLTEPSWTNPRRRAEPAKAADVLHDYRVFCDNWINTFPRWSGQLFLYPPSHLLREVLRKSLASIEPDNNAYNRLVSRYEYRVALVQHRIENPWSLPASGEFILDSHWTVENELEWEADFRATADLAKWGGTPDEMETSLANLRAHLSNFRRW